HRPSTVHCDCLAAGASTFATPDTSTTVPSTASQNTRSRSGMIIALVDLADVDANEHAQRQNAVSHRASSRLPRAACCTAPARECGAGQCAPPGAVGVGCVVWRT
ncbi:hypothetical protein FRC12_022121, partial [Ceratobasidium sp. 428]